MLAAVITWVMTLNAPNRPSNSHSARCATAQPCISSVQAVEAQRERATGRHRQRAARQQAAIADEHRTGLSRTRKITSRTLAEITRKLVGCFYVVKGVLESLL
jgi:hypothetical protein